MTRPKKTAPKNDLIALAMTWDGARWPAGKLPPKARAFLQGRSGKIAPPAAKSAAKHLAADQVREIRVCWVPCLKGGDAVLSEPFLAPNGRRIPFQIARRVNFGDILGVVYRRVV